MTCLICNRKYDEYQVVLGCLHGFCRKCFSGDTCPVCQKPHKNHLQEVRNFFPIPSILEVLKYLGFASIPMRKAENVVYVTPMKCDVHGCGMFGQPYECLDLIYDMNIVRPLCSRCSTVYFDPETGKIEGNVEVFFEFLQEKSKEQRIISNHELLLEYFGFNILVAEGITSILFSKFGSRDIISPEDCNRVLQIINDCQPTNTHWSDEHKFYMNKIAKRVASHCLEWHKVPQCQYFLKNFKGQAFGYEFQRERKLNIHLVAYFIYCLRTDVMADVDWFGSKFPDGSAYICEAILQK